MSVEKKLKSQLSSLSEFNEGIFKKSPHNEDLGIKPVFLEPIKI